MLATLHCTQRKLLRVTAKVMSNVQNVLSKELQKSSRHIVKGLMVDFQDLDLKQSQWPFLAVLSEDLKFV